MRSFELPEALEELTEFNQWVVYTYDRDGGLDKTPKQPNGSNASSTNTRTWSSYSECTEAHANNSDIAGLGFVLTENDPYTVIDLDHCIEDEMVNDMADEVVGSFGTYSEISPSETGLHIWIRGVLGKGRKRGDVECYDRGRYITVTGSPYKGGMIEERQTELANFIAVQYDDEDATDGVLFPSQSKKVDISGFLGKRNGTRRNVKRRTLEDAEILNRCRKADDGERFISVYDRGDYGAADFPSGSEADAYLLGTFCFWTAGDFERSWALLRKSGLRNDPNRLKKWARGDYRDRTWALVEDGLHHCEVEAVEQICNDSRESLAYPDSLSNGLDGVGQSTKSPSDGIDVVDQCVYRDATGNRVYVLNVDEDGNRSYVDLDGRPISDDDRILYRMDEVSGSALEGRSVAIFPDEASADAFVGHAINFTPTTVPGIWTDEMAGALKGCKKVLLFMDRELAEVLAAELDAVGVPSYWPGDGWSESPAQKFEALQEKHRHEEAVAKVEMAIQMAIRLEPAPVLPPLDEEVNLHDFPLEVFPQPVRRFVRELSDELKWDTGPVGAAVLGIAASAVCDKYIVRISGLRPQEIRGLKFSDIIGLGNGYPCIHIEHHKTSSSSKVPRPRSVPLTQSAVEIIERQRAAHGESEHVFLNGAGTPYTKQALLNRFRRLCRRAGVPEQPIYALRHVFGSRLAANSTNQAILAQLMGHSNLQTTARYVAHSDKAHREAAQIMERLLD